MKRSFLCSILVLCLATLAQAQQARPVQVRTVPIAQRAVSATAQVTGTIYFDRTSQVSSEEASKILAAPFREGDRVRKGDLLARLDTRVLEKELALQKARLAQAAIRLDQARINLDRQTQLLKTHATPESVYDDQRFLYQGLIKEEEVLERQVEILTIRISKHEIRAPFDALVLEKQAEQGEWAGPGSPICLLGALEEIYVQVAVAEDLVRFVTPGQTLLVRSKALDQTLESVFTGIRPVADPRTKNVTLKLKLDHKGLLAQNMSVSVAVPVSEKETLFIMPRDALVQVRGEDTVYTVEQGKAAAHKVVQVWSMEDQIGVRAEGLLPGMAVVTLGNDRLAPGQTVETGN